MPIFEYRCEACQRTSEKITSNPPLEIPCPTCGQPAKKAISVFATSSSASPGGGGCGSGQGCGSGFT